MKRVTPGVYRHYKGALYTVILIAMESTNNRKRERLVVYVSHGKGSINSRREAEFTEVTKWPDGKLRPRFKRVSGPPT